MFHENQPNCNADIAKAAIKPLAPHCKDNIFSLFKGLKTLTDNIYRF